MFIYTWDARTEQMYRWHSIASTSLGDKVCQLHHFSYLVVVTSSPPEHPCKPLIVWACLIQFSFKWTTGSSCKPEHRWIETNLQGTIFHINYPLCWCCGAFMHVIFSVDNCPCVGNNQPVASCWLTLAAALHPQLDSVSVPQIQSCDWSLLPPARHRHPSTGRPDGDRRAGRQRS